MIFRSLSIISVCWIGSRDFGILTLFTPLSIKGLVCFEKWSNSEVFTCESISRIDPAALSETIILYNSFVVYYFRPSKILFRSTKLLSNLSSFIIKTLFVYFILNTRIVVFKYFFSRQLISYFIFLKILFTISIQNYPIYCSFYYFNSIFIIALTYLLSPAAYYSFINALKWTIFLLTEFPIELMNCLMIMIRWFFELNEYKFYWYFYHFQLML